MSDAMTAFFWLQSKVEAVANYHTLNSQAWDFTMRALPPA
jgi:hypothetical protein